MSRKRTAPGGKDDVVRNMDNSLDKVGLDIQRSSSSRIITLKKLREKVAFATAREKFAAHVLKGSSTVLITEDKPEQLYPLLLNERLFDTAACLASEVELPLAPLFEALTKQFLSDQSRKDLDVSLMDDSDKSSSTKKCEYSDACPEGRELEYYLERYGNIDHYALVARLILASQSSVSVSEAVTDRLQKEQPWILVSLYTNVGKLQEAAKVALAMIPASVHLSDRVPLHCIDELLICLDDRSRSVRSEDDAEVYKSLASSLRRHVSVFVNQKH